MHDSNGLYTHARRQVTGCAKGVVAGNCHTRLTTAVENSGGGGGSCVCSTTRRARCFMTGSHLQQLDAPRPQLPKQNKSQFFLEFLFCLFFFFLCCLFRFNGAYTSGIGYIDTFSAAGARDILLLHASRHVIRNILCYMVGVFSCCCCRPRGYIR